jgi:hypothetical protein
MNEPINIKVIDCDKEERNEIIFNELMSAYTQSDLADWLIAIMPESALDEIHRNILEEENKGE